MNLPRVIHFPFGYTVAVKQVSETEMKAEISDDEEVPDGLWDCETRTIYILRSLSVRRKRYILGHEMGHAWLDWSHELLNEEAMKV